MFAVLPFASSDDEWPQPQIDHSIRAKRVEQIKTRLIKLGWGDEVSYARNQIYKHELVARAEDLTEKEWKRILPMLEHDLGNVRKQRLERLSLERFMNHWDSFLEFYASFKKKAVILPPPIEFVLFKPFQALLLETHISVRLTGNDFEMVQEGIEEFCAEWKTVKQQQLLGMVLGRPATGEEIENAEEILNLATTGFTCGHCPTYPNVITYPEILHHRHTTHPDAFVFDDRFPTYLRLGFKYACGYTCNEMYLRRTIYHPSYRQAATRVVKECGMDPKTATVYDMNLTGQVGVIHDDGAVMVLPNWQSAVEFYMEL